MPPRLPLLILLLAAHVALGQGADPNDYPDEFVDHGPDVFNLLFLLVFLIFIAVCCVLIGIGIVLGLAILAGLALMVGAGGMAFGISGLIASLTGAVASRKPKVGWRIFSMWMHAGLMAVAGAVIGAFVLPYFLLDPPGLFGPLASLASGFSIYTGLLGAVAGLATGLLWGWLLALGVERCGGFLKDTLFPGCA